MKSQKILVIGGAGHVGSNLLEHFKNHNSNYELTSIDNYTNGTSKNHIGGVKYINGDARDIGSLVEPNFDCVIHLGEFARLEQSFHEYQFVVENNIVGTLRVIEFCRRFNIKLVYSASSAITTMHEPGLVNAPYTITKLANANLLNSLGQFYKLDYAIVYFYNVYGPREVGRGKNATVVEKFLQLKFLNQKAAINFPGTQRRNFTDVRDIVDGIHKVVDKGQGDGYFIGNPESFSIIELAELIGIDYSIGSKKFGNRESSIIDTSKMKKLGWEPKYNLKTYILKRLMERS